MVDVCVDALALSNCTWLLAGSMLSTSMMDGIYCSNADWLEILSSSSQCTLSPVVLFAASLVEGLLCSSAIILFWAGMAWISSTVSAY